MSIRNSLAWMSICQLLSFVLLFGSSVVVAHYLTPKEMGVFGVGVAIVGVISIVQNLGLPAFIVREETLSEDVIASAFSVNAVVAMLLSGLIVAASFGGEILFKDAGVRHVLLVLALTPLIGMIAFVPWSLLEREGQFRTIAWMTVASNVINAVFTIGLAIQGFSYMSLAYGQLAGTLTLNVLVLAVGRDKLHFRMGFRGWRRVAGFTSQMLIVSGVSTATWRLCEISLGRILGLRMLGLYNRASGMNNLLWSNIYYLLSRVLLVEFSELNRRSESLRERYLQMMAVMTAFLWPAFAGMAVIASPLIQFVYGDQWLPATKPFVLLAIASMVWVPITLCWELFAGTGDLRPQTRIEVIRAVFAVVTFPAACFISLEAAVATRILDGLLAFVLYRPYVSRMTATTLKDLWWLYFQSACLTIAAIAPAATIMLIFGHYWSPLLLLIATVPAGVVLWVIGLAVFRHPLWVQLVRLLGSAVGVRSSPRTGWQESGASS